MTEAHAYPGLLLLTQGKTAEALPHLQWVIDKGKGNYVEYRMAETALDQAKSLKPVVLAGTKMHD